MQTLKIGMAFFAGMLLLTNHLVAQDKFTLPALPYSFSALEPYIDAQTMQIHHDKHHQAYVTNLNKAAAQNYFYLSGCGAQQCRRSL